MKMPDTTKAASSTHRTGQIVPSTASQVKPLALVRTTGQSDHVATTGDVATWRQWRQRRQIGPVLHR